MAKKIRTILQKEIDWRTVYVPKNKAFLWDRSNTFLTDYLDGKIDSKKTCINVDLESRASWLGASGVLKIFQGDPDGWVDIRRSLQNWYWSQRIYYRYGQRKWIGKGSVIRIHTTMTLAYGLAVNDTQLIPWCGDLLLRGRTDPTAFAVHLDFDSPLPSLMEVLYGKWRGEEIPYRPHPKGASNIYRELLQAWDDLPKLAEKLVAACQYHCVQSNHGKDTPEAVFIHNPFCVFPVEILAIQAVRAREGLPMPAFSHELVDGNPLMHVPAEIPPYSDELLDRLIRHMEIELEGL